MDRKQLSTAKIDLMISRLELEEGKNQWNGLKGKKYPKKALPSAVPFKRFNVGVIERRVTADYEFRKGPIHPCDKKVRQRQCWVPAQTRHRLD